MYLNVLAVINSPDTGNRHDLLLVSVSPCVLSGNTSFVHCGVVASALDGGFPQFPGGKICPSCVYLHGITVFQRTCIRRSLGT